MSEKPKEGGRGRRVYVGHLNYKTTWQDLKDHMRKCGNVVYADILRDQWNNSRGCGIVEYETEAEAAESINVLNDTEIDGFKIFIREDREDQGFGFRKNYQMHNFVEGCKIYVGNLPYSFRWQDLKDEFKKIGNVVRADIMEDYRGYSKGSGTVEFETPEEAQLAIEKYNGFELGGRIVNVRLFQKH